MQKQVIEFLKKYTQKNCHLVAAVSGGLDSMVLLHVLNSIKNHVGFRLSAVHIEHGIRGEDSKADAEFVKTYTEKNNIPLHFFEVDVPSLSKLLRQSIEECARNQRYEVFYKLLDGSADKIVLAHHADDQAETIFMRIMRGTGVTGLAGMASVRDNAFLRPFLDTTRLELEEYAKQNNVPHITDQTNLCDDYTRNFIRNQVFPLLNTRFLGFNQSLLRLSRQAEILKADLETRAASLIERHDEGHKEECIHPVRLCLPPLKEGNVLKIDLSVLSDDLLLKPVLDAIYSSFGITKDIEYRHAQVLKKLIDAENGAELHLPFGITAYKEYGKIAFVTNNSCATTQQNAIKPIPKKQLRYDVDKLPPDVVRRNSLAGDVFTKFGGGTKKLCDYLTDKKIPKRLRPTLEVLAKDNIVYAIINVEISDLIKVDDNTKNIGVF